ncbi:MAG: hypothetical protein N3D10_02175 [Candidatus Micrarchaeota archaeon]|nr:hypothetical protein [Candidatus Micrarchaeota archaeon]
MDEKTFKIILEILKKHLSYLEKRGVKLIAKLEASSISFVVVPTKKNKITKSQKERAILASKRLVNLLINLNDNI